MTRYVLEGIWSGYSNPASSGQRRPVHREIVTSRTRIERLQNLTAIRYTDGTHLEIRFRKALPREKVALIGGYDRLIRQAEATGKSYVRVEDLP